MKSIISLVLCFTVGAFAGFIFTLGADAPTQFGFGNSPRYGLPATCSYGDAYRQWHETYYIEYTCLKSGEWGPFSEKINFDKFAYCPAMLRRAEAEAWCGRMP